VHLSIQRTHVHMLVEADDKAALSAGMHGFQISAAKQLNAAIGKERGGPRRRGTVFPDRFHAVVISSPRQARHALSYVINNGRKHGEQHDTVARAWKIDPFSSAVLFRGWTEWTEGFSWILPPTYQALVCTPREHGCCARAGNEMARSPIWTYRPRATRRLDSTRTIVRVYISP
jgi:hypothetical protein